VWDSPRQASAQTEPALQLLARPSTRPRQCNTDYWSTPNASESVSGNS
jgi:hypothetical protein